MGLIAVFFAYLPTEETSFPIPCPQISLLAAQGFHHVTVVAISVIQQSLHDKQQEYSSWTCNNLSFWLVLASSAGSSDLMYHV